MNEELMYSGSDPTFADRVYESFAKVASKSKGALAASLLFVATSASSVLVAEAHEFSSMVVYSDGSAPALDAGRPKQVVSAVSVDEYRRRFAALEAETFGETSTEATRTLLGQAGKVLSLIPRPQGATHFELGDVCIFGADGVDRLV